MSASDGKSEHGRKETMGDGTHKSRMEPEDQNKEEFKPISPMKRTKYTLQKRQIEVKDQSSFPVLNK